MRFECLILSELAWSRTLLDWSFTHTCEAVIIVLMPQEIVAKEGYLGLFGRGLKTKILANGLQGLMFTVLWRIGQDMWNKSEVTSK